MYHSNRSTSGSTHRSNKRSRIWLSRFMISCMTEDIIPTVVKMAQIAQFLSVWTCMMVIFLSVFALADNTWPSEIDRLTFGKRTLAVALYVISIIAGSITLWEVYKSVGGGGGGGGY
jgi:hypothetical protein